ncbi:type II secretion system F family protein [Poriferisphaera sp. WC338]|uniref:type II secretion system F family protein n=1 Tax=Poriferisphaera sp. WC338 TaxID=3425129 RepID=UPI003D817210
MTNTNLYILLSINLILTFTCVYLLIRYGYQPAKKLWLKQERSYENALCKQLLLDVNPRHMMFGTGAMILFAFLFGLVALENVVAAMILAACSLLLPAIITNHLEYKRKKKLESQLIDGLTTLSSGVRAGLNLVQSMELLVANHTGPIQQEFSQLLREYQMGLDLNQAMRNTTTRISSPLYRLVFTAIEMHRKRGGNTSHSLDRISESVREIYRLEGKLDAITAHGRFQAIMMSIMPFVFITMLYFADSEGVTMLFTDAVGRIILICIICLMFVSFLWIRKILSVDI